MPHPAKRLLKEIARANQQATARGAELDPGAVAGLLERALATAPDRHLLILGLAEFIACSLDGSVPDLEVWRPLISRIP